MRKSSGNSLMPLLLILMAGLFFRFITTDNDIKDIKKMNAQIKKINSQTNAMLNMPDSINNVTDDRIPNAGDANLDVAYSIIRTVLNDKKDIDITNRQKEILTLGAHYLVFENAMTHGRQTFCSAFDVDISDYFSIFYRENKEIRTSLKNFLNTYGFVSLLKETVTAVLKDEKVSAGIKSFVASDFAKTEEENGKDARENCKILPMGDLVFGDKFSDTINYKTKYSYNYRQIIGE